MPDVRYLLWDFGDTLVDERWMWPCPEGVANWTDSYRALGSGAVGSRWNRGELTLRGVRRRRSPPMSGSASMMQCTHMQRCCDRFDFFEHTWATARSHVMPQAIVTVNPDLFTTVHRAQLRTSTRCSTRSSRRGRSAREDKARLCEIALERLGGSDPAEALLIDNIEANVEAWRALGGQAYLFLGDDRVRAPTGYLREDAERAGGRVRGEAVGDRALPDVERRLAAVGRDPRTRRGSRARRRAATCGAQPS